MMSSTQTEHMTGVGASGFSHLGVCDEDGWWAGSVQDFPAADFPHATPDVWIVPAQDLHIHTEGGKRSFIIPEPSLAQR